MTDEELIAKFQARVAAGEIDLRPFGELIFGKFDQDWPARLIARLEAAEANLKWEQHRAGRIGTHSEDCHTWGPQHYECLLRKFNEAEARNATAYAEGVEAAAKAVEAYKRDASFDDSQVGALEHNSNEENIVCAIRSLLKDKPNG